MKVMKKVILGLLVMAVITGGVCAYETGVETSGIDASLNLGTLTQVSYFDTGIEFDLFADGGRKPSGGNPFFAGLLNMPAGLWSWMNKDWVGGGITAGLLAAGIGLAVYTVLSTDDAEDAPIGKMLLAAGLIVASPIYGFFRGMSKYKKMRAASETAMGDNPLDHITLVVMPTFGERNSAVGSLSYSMSY